VGSRDRLPFFVFVQLVPHLLEFLLFLVWVEVFLLHAPPT
jgi:hypothetical protein